MRLARPPVQPYPDATVRRVLISSLVAGLGLLLVPAAFAGSFSWSQPADFTGVASGASYGPAAWGYSASSGALSYASSFDGGALAGWTDSASAPTTWAAVSKGSTPSSVQLVPPEHGSVILTWTSPLPQSVSVAVQGTVSEPDAGGTLGGQCASSWTLSGSSQALASGAGAGTTTIPSQSVTVAPGGTISLTVTDASSGLLGDPYTTSCVATDVALALSAPGSAPAVTISSPAAGAQLPSGSSPTFSGTASTGSTVSSTVGVLLYSGSSASGTPVRTLASSEAGGSWSVNAGSALPAGTYTAVAEQSDLASPPDSGLSVPVTFSVSSGSSGGGGGGGGGAGDGSLTLNSLGSSPLGTGEVSLSGTASTVPGAASTVQISVYDGAAQAVRTLSATVGSSGAFQATIAPALADGFYGAIATQSVNGATLTSQPVFFTVQTQTSELTLFFPYAGTRTALDPPVLFGQAGGSQPVTVTLYAGSAAEGDPWGRASAKVQNGIWLVRWPRRIPVGLYTAIASQSGSTTAARTFMVVPASGVIGPSVSVAQNGLTSVAISCPAPAGELCTGRLTIGSAQKIRVGRRRPTRPTLISQPFVVPGGTVTVVRAHMRGSLRAALTHVRGPRAVVSVTLVAGQGPQRHYRATRRLAL
jgi:hypothetical protein